MSATDEPRRMPESGYPHTLRPELHRSLDAAGIEYWVAQGLTYWNCPDGRGCVAYGYQANGKPVLGLKIVGITDPEQAIAATLGSFNCTNGERTSDEQAIAATLGRGTCQQEDGGWSTEGDHARVWLTCGHDCMVETVADLPNFCPVCGAKVVSE